MLSSHDQYLIVLKTSKFLQDELLTFQEHTFICSLSFSNKQWLRNKTVYKLSTALGFWLHESDVTGKSYVTVTS